MGTRNRGSKLNKDIADENVMESLKSIQEQMFTMNQSLISLTGEVAQVRVEMDHLKDIKESLELSQSQLDSTNKELDNLKVTVSKQSVQFDEISGKLAASQKENYMLKEKLLSLDSYIRRENLKFSGIPENKDETSDGCKKIILKFFVEKLGIINGDQIKLQRCHRLGSKSQHSMKGRDIIARFLWFGDRQNVWNQRNKLQDTGIIMKEDFPAELEERRFKLYPIYKAAREMNKRASLIADKLYIEGKLFTVDTLNLLPLNLQPRKLALRENDNSVLFYGKDTVFSNFYPSKFEIDGQTFCSAEQYFQCQLAVKCGDEEAKNAIMKTSNPVEQLRLGRKVRVDEGQWNNDVAKQVMEKGIQAKFEQNEVLKRELLATGVKQIVQCSKYDKFWGVGLNLKDGSAFEKKNWKGENALGNILLVVREKLK